MKAKIRLLIFLEIVLASSCGFAQIQPGAQLWSYATPGAVTGCPAFANDGIIYLGTAAGLCAITNAGSNKWIFPANVSASPAIATNGTIYFADFVGVYYALNPDGSTNWSYSTPNQVRSSPAIGMEGSIYYSTAQAQLIGFTPDGHLKWPFPDDSNEGAVQASSPVIGPDGTIYLGSFRGQLAIAMKPDGSRKWSYPVGSGPGESAAIGADGTIYFGGAGLFAFSPAGSNIWSAAGIFNRASPAIASDGTIYIAQEAADHSLYAFSPGGESLWHAGYGPSLYGFPTTCPAIDGAGNIYYAASNSVFAINSQGVVQWTFSSPLANTSQPTGISPAIGPDGTIYAAFGNVLYAIQGFGNPLATSPWPMLRQNLRHTGKVEKPVLAPPKKRADANFDIQLAGEIGQAYSVQSTSNFLNWDFVTNFVANTVPVTVSDLTATNAAARFYRATTP